jgi:hypothetical protein
MDEDAGLNAGLHHQRRYLQVFDKHADERIVDVGHDA